VMGQAAGSASALANQAGIAPRAVDVGTLQKQLENDGAFLGRTD